MQLTYRVIHPGSRPRLPGQSGLAHFHTQRPRCSRFYPSFSLKISHNSPHIIRQSNTTPITDMSYERVDLQHFAATFGTETGSRVLISNLKHR